MNIQAEFLTLSYEIVNKRTPARMQKTILECLALILVKHITKCISLPRCTENYAKKFHANTQEWFISYEIRIIKPQIAAPALLK